jgi:hypothetical protein
MTWVTGTATDYQNLLVQLKQIATSNHVETAVISAAGSGYTVGDILTAVGGTFTHAAKFRVTTIGGGGSITGLVVSEGGAYTVNPASPVATTGGTGTLATVTVTFLGTGWTSLIDATFGGSEKVLMLQGNGSGTDTIYVGITTFTATAQDGFNTAKNWGLWATTGYNNLLNWYAQPGISPGFSGTTGAVTATGGAYVALKPSTAFNISFWFSITGRRIIGVFKVQTGSTVFYSSMYLGFNNPYGTTTEFPYPIHVQGSSARANSYYADTTIGRITGLTEAIGIQSMEGPAFYRRSDSAWVTIRNSFAADTGSPTRTATKDYVIYPCGQGNIEGATDDVIVAAGQGTTWDDIIAPSGVPGTETYKLQPTPNGGAGIRILIPATITASDDDLGSNDVELIGDLDYVFWFSAVLGVTSEDYMDIGTTRYRIFQNGNRVTDYSFMCVREG